MCNFSIEFKTPREQIVQEAAKAISDQGGIFNVTGDTGNFSFTKPAHVEGTFTVVGNQVEITITKKPMFIPCSMIESKLKELNL